jgi:hypothetical protein
MAAHAYPALHVELDLGGRGGRESVPRYWLVESCGLETWVWSLTAAIHAPEERHGRDVLRS